jgi:hypothetical protein
LPLERNMSALHPFRLAFPVHDLVRTDALEIKAFADITQLFAK